MVCPFCGKELRGDEFFCPDCSDSMGITTSAASRTAVAERPAAPERRPGTPPPRKRRSLLYLLTILCALSLSALALLAGAYYDTADPFGLQGLLWPDESSYAVPPEPGAPFDPDAPPDGLTPIATPVSRGAPTGDDRDNAARLLRAAVSLTRGLSADIPPGDLSGFLWQAVRWTEPWNRFDGTPDGCYIEQADFEDVCRETLGHVPDAPPDHETLTRADSGWQWQDGFTDEYRIDIFEWTDEPDGSVHLCFNVLIHGMLYDSFVRQGEALLLPNGAPVYYRYHLSALTWNDVARFTPSRISASSSLRGQDGTSYMPNRLIDGNPATAWAADTAGAAGDSAAGVGQWLELSFDSPREITGLTLVNGCCKDLLSMRQFSRVGSLRVDCGGFTMDIELDDIPDYYTGGDYQSFTFGQAVTADRIRLTVLSVYKGTSGGQVSLSELSLF